eukprot:365876-Chlamydomonas_euryale.AAC.11
MNSKVTTVLTHDVSFLGFTAGCVVKSGVSKDLAVDYHRSPSHGNAVVDVKCGHCARLYRCGGGDLGPAGRGRRNAGHEGEDCGGGADRRRVVQIQEKGKKGGGENRLGGKKRAARARRLGGAGGKGEGVRRTWDVVALAGTLNRFRA